MIEWLLYNTLIPLLPVPLVMLGRWLQGSSSNVVPILCDGQLCFYCTALSAVALRDIISAEGTNYSGIGLSIGGIIFCMILSVYAYGIAVRTEAHTSKSEKRIALTSIMTAATTTIIVANIRQALGLL